MKEKYQDWMKALAALTVLATAISVVRADFNYPTGFGSWNYMYSGDAAVYGAGTAGSWDALDGTWSHSGPTFDGAGSDLWDGSGIGGTLGPLNAPGGVQSQSGYLRMQDPGLTTGTDWASGQNSAILFGKNINSMVTDPFNILDGVTLRFRIRVPTGTGMDPLYYNGTQVAAYPTVDGDGYANVNQGLGGIGIKASGLGLPSARGQGAISFSLGTKNETFSMPSNTNTTASAAGAALYMNNLYQDTIYNNVDWNEQGTRTSPPYVNNHLDIDDATVWNDFWVTITENDTTPFGVQGTHTVTIWMNGDYATPHVFAVTAGNDNEDFGNMAAIMMGLPRSGLQGENLTSGAMDVDFFAFKEGVWAPVPEPSAMACMGLGLLALAARFRRNRRN
jgi:hypothetical protein